MQEQTLVNLSPALQQQLNRLKVISRYNDEEGLLKACFDAFEREWSHGGQPANAVERQPYMSHPGLSPDDYDT